MNMKRELLDILCCPVCKGNLELRVSKEKDGNILEGELVCNKCRVSYEIKEGIPNLLPK